MTHIDDYHKSEKGQNPHIQIAIIRQLIRHDKQNHDGITSFALSCWSTEITNIGFDYSDIVKAVKRLHDNKLVESWCDFCEHVISENNEWKIHEKSSEHKANRGNNKVKRRGRGQAKRLLQLTLEGFKMAIDDPLKTNKEYTGRKIIRNAWNGDKREEIKIIWEPITHEQFWKCLVNYHEEENSEIEKNNVRQIFDEFKEKLGIPEKLVNPLGSARMLDLLKVANDENFWIIEINHKKQNYKNTAIEILKAYALRQKTKIKKYENVALWAEGSIEQEIQFKFARCLLLYELEKMEISVFGILFLIHNLSNDEEREEVIKLNRDKLPLVFDENIWSDIKQLITDKTSWNVYETLTDYFTYGFTQVFDDSAYWPRLNRLNQLYNIEYVAYRKLKEFTDSGIEIINNLTNKECRDGFFGYLNSWNPLPNELKKYENTCAELKKYQMLTERYHEDYEQYVHLHFEEKIIKESLQNAVTFHLYTYLQNNDFQDESIWFYDFVNKHQNVKEFWEAWCQEISEFNKPIEVKTLGNSIPT